MAQMYRLPGEEARPCVAEVERAWLDAARNSEVDQMNMLRVQFPEALDLKREINCTMKSYSADGRSTETAPFCSWDGFHLGTIGDSTLHTAAWYGNKKTVEYLLEAGQDPDAQDSTGMTPIMLVITHHNLQAQRCVFRDRDAVQRNLVIDCRQEDAERVQGTVGLIELLVHFHADMNKRCNRGSTALHLATTDDTLEVAKVLLDHGANIDAQDEEGKSPLHHCIPSSLLAANLLIQRGANLHLPDNNGVTPLNDVIRSNDLNMLQVILSQHELVVTNEGEDFAGAALLMAIDEDALSTAAFLLEETYITVQHQNVHGETPMHRAILKQRVAMTSLLRRFDVNARVVALRTTEGESCVHYAARYSSPEELQYLVDFCGQWRNEEDPERFFNDDVSITLLNCANSAGNTPLLLAGTATSDSIAIRDAKTQLLLDSGARFFSPDTIFELTTMKALSTPRLTLPAVLQACLSCWLTECSMQDVREFCLTYLAIIADSDRRQRQVSYEVLGIVVSSEHAIDSVALLLSLPFDRAAMSTLLEHVETFGIQQNHSLIISIHRELMEVWTSL